MPDSPRLAVSVALVGLFVASLPLPAQTAVGKADMHGSAAVEACERAARQAVNGPAARPIEVVFAGAPAKDASLSNDSQIVLRGEGRWRAANGLRSFRYSCNVDLQTSETVGLVMRDSTPSALAPVSAPAEPDLSALSPTDCESSAAEALKQRWPRVSQINFDVGTRRFIQPSASRSELHGRGRALPAPGLPLTFFGFDCQVDPRDGRVLGTSVSG